MRISGMRGKKAFEPGQLVTSLTGQLGVVVSQDTLSKARSRLKEGRRPGHFFAPGCCQNPDYVTQLPVLFEDGSYDVMRAMNIKRAKAPPAEKVKVVERLLENLEAEDS